MSHSMQALSSNLERTSWYDSPVIREVLRSGLLKTDRTEQTASYAGMSRTTSVNLPELISQKKP
jgi:hypothetical protein